MLLAGVHLLLAARFRVASSLEHPSIGFSLVGFGIVLLVLLFAICFFASVSREKMFHDAGIATKIEWLALLMMLGGGTILRYRLIKEYPVNAVYGDMLPLIVAACESLLQGNFPYIHYDVPWELPLTFLPGLWLPYLPFVSTGVDPRWLGIMAVWGVGVVIYFAASECPLRYRMTAMGLVALFVYSPAWLDFTIQGHTQILWFYIALFGLFVTRSNTIGSCVMMGLLLASRQTMLILVPPLFLWLLFHLSWRATFRHLAWIALPLFLLMIPFLLKDPEAVLLEPIRHYNELAAYERTRGDAGYLAQTPGLTYAFVRADAEDKLRIVAWFALAVIWGGALVYARKTTTLLCGCGAGLFLMNALTPIPWYYIFAPPLILLSMALTASIREIAHE